MKSRYTLYIFLLVTVCFIFLTGCNSSPQAVITVYITPNPTPTPEPTPTPRIITEEEQFAVDGLLALKLNLKDPNSLELNRAVFNDSGEYLEVYVDISAKNGFGGVQRDVYFFSHERLQESLGWYDNTHDLVIYQHEILAKYVFDLDSSQPLDCKWIMENVNSEID